MHSLLIVGCGSIGERQLRCFQRTERARLAACDASLDLLERIRGRYSVPSYPSVVEALDRAKFTGMVICTPAHTHLSIAREGARRGLDLFIEKPLAVALEGIDQTRTALAQSGRFVAVAYVYHLMPWMLEAREFLRGGELGRALHVTVSSGQHFPTFRPAYREIYYTRHEHGGGAIQDALTHLVNAMEWMIGPVTRLFADASHQALEGVTVEDTVNVAARHGDVLASYAMNQFQAANETRFAIHCERGSIGIEPHRRRWGFVRLGEGEWHWDETPPMERDDLFLAQAHAFLDGCEGRPTPLCTFEEAVQTLKFNLAALESSRTGRPITLG
jgi:predicted dehydrogenase